MSKCSFFVAWYSSTQSAKAASINNQAGPALTVADPSYQMSSNLELPVKMTVTENGGPRTLELVHYFESGTGAGKISELDGAIRAEGKVWETTEDDADETNKFYAAPGYYKAYWDQTETYLVYSKNNKDTYSFFKAYTITITIDESVYNHRQAAGEGSNDCYRASDGSIWSALDIAKKLAEENITITLRQDSSRAMFFGLAKTGTAITALPAAAAGETTLSLDTNLTGIYVASPSAAIGSVVLNFGLYVDGIGDGTADSDTVSGNFTISLAHTE